MLYFSLYTLLQRIEHGLNEVGGETLYIPQDQRWRIGAAAGWGIGLGRLLIPLGILLEKEKGMKKGQNLGLRFWGGVGLRAFIAVWVGICWWEGTSCSGVQGRGERERRERGRERTSSRGLLWGLAALVFQTLGLLGPFEEPPLTWGLLLLALVGGGVISGFLWRRQVVPA